MVDQNEQPKPKTWVDKLKEAEARAPSFFRQQTDFDSPAWRDNPRKDFWKHAEEVIARGGRLVPRYGGIPKDRTGYEFTGPQSVQFTQDDWWKMGRPGASAVGAQGRSFADVQKEVELAKHPGAIGMSEMGAPVYGGKDDYEERQLRAEASLRYGQGVIEELDLSSLQQQQFATTGPLAERMDLAIDAYGDKTAELEEEQAKKTSNKVYWGIYNTVGKQYHNFREGGAIITRHLAGRAYEWAIEDNEKYTTLLEESAPQDYQAVLDAVFQTNARTQLYGASILADASETLMWRLMPWSFGKEENLSLMPDLVRAKAYIENHPGMPAHLLINNTVNPFWHDMAEEWLNVSEFAMDWTIDLGVRGVGKAWKALNKNRVFTKNLRRVLGGMDEVKRLGGLDDTAFQVAKQDGLVKAYRDDLVETVDSAHKWADNNGIFTHTNETKAALTAEQSHEGVRWMVDAMEGKADIPEFYDMLRTIAKLADDDLDILDEGLQAITRYGNFEFWFTKQGQAAAWVMKNVVDTDPKLLNKMVLEIGGEANQAKKMAKMLTYSDNLSTEWTGKFFPTLEEQLRVGTKAGGELPSHLRAAAAAHKQSRKLYGPIVNLFSEMYLGKTPGYAVRNTVQNFAQTIFDLGIDSVDGFKYIDDAFDWAGVERAVDVGKIAGTQAGNVFMVGMERGLGMATQYQDVAKGKKRFLDMKWWSNEAEKLGGRIIFGDVYPKFMKKAMTGPVKRQFVKMGVSPADANRWQDLIIKYKGNVKEASKQIIKEADQGFRRTLAVSGFTPELQKTIDAFRIRSKIDNIIDTAGSKEEAIAQLKDYGKGVMKRAEEAVLKEGTNAPSIQHGKEGLGRLATAVMDGEADRALLDAHIDYDGMNEAVNNAVSDALDTFKAAVVDSLGNAFESQEEGLKVFKGILEEATFTPTGRFTNVGPMSGFQFMDRKFSPRKGKIEAMERGIKHKSEVRKANIPDDASPAEMKAFWKSSGLQDEFGEWYEMGWKEVNNKIWESNSKELKLFWEQWRDQNYNFATQLIDDTMQKAQVLGASDLKDPGLMKSKMVEKYDAALKFDKRIPQVHVNLNLRKARKYDDAAKANRVYAVEYARRYGVADELYAIKDGKEYFLDAKLTNIINKQLGTDFADLNSIIGPTEPEIRDALRNQALGKLRSLISNPEEALESIVKILDDPINVSKADEAVFDNMINVLAETNRDLAREFNGAFRTRNMLPGAPGVWTPEFGVEAKTADQYNAMVKRVDEAQANLEKSGKKVEEFLNLRATKSDTAVDDIAEQVLDAQTKVNKYPTEWGGEDPASVGRMLYDSRKEYNRMIDQVAANFSMSWDDIQKVEVKDAAAYKKTIEQAERVGIGMVREARQGAAKAAKETRDFILHNYGNRRNFDTLLAYLYPFHFWHSRNAANWAKRIARKPYVAKAYVKYKENMKKINDDMPEWYRYNIKYDGGLFGFDEDNPLFVNLEALINPNYGILKVPFRDHDKRKTSFSKFLDNLGSRGPSLHTPFALLYGFAQYIQGDEEAGAKWMGRFIPQTAPLSALTARFGMNEGRGIELDPSLIIQNVMKGNDVKSSFSALGPYELNRINAALSQMVLAEKITQEEAVDAGMEQGENPIWVQAHALAQSKRNFGDILRFIGGPGMQGRNKDEMTIMKMDQEFYALMDVQNYMDPDEKAKAFKILRDKYPVYFNVTRLTRGSQQEREESLVYNVMSRLPPGQSSQVYEAVGINYENVQDFYDSKGESLESMPEADRMKFMAGIYEMSAILAFPTDATKNEWNEVSRRWKLNDARLLEFHGADTVGKEDKYWRLMKEDPQTAYDYMDQNPDLEAFMSDRTQSQLFDPLLRKYYPSYGGVRSMVNAEMYARLDAEFPGIEAEQDAYYEARDAGKRVKASENLKSYWSLKRVLKHEYSALLVSFSRWLPTGVDLPKREVLPENLSKGQEALRDLEVGEEQPQHYNWEWEDWSKIMNPTLQRLVQDWAYRGADLSENAETSLKYALEPFGIDIAEALHLMRDASKRAGAEYYSEENPPWWLDEE